MASTPSQLIQQATRHAAHLERLKAGDMNEIRRILREAQERLLGRLARNDITSWTRKRAEQQLAAFSDMLRESYTTGVIPALNRHIRELAEYEAGFEVRSLDNVALRHQFTLPSADQVLTAVRTNPLTMAGPGGGLLLADFIDDFTASNIKRTVGAIRSGFAQGQTTPQVIARLRTLELPLEERGIRTMARTALQHVATQTREEVWRRNADIIKRVRIVATLDDVTSQQCQALDGQVFPIDEGPRPPFHLNCRTTVVAVLDDRFAVLSEGATRSARDPETGKVISAPAKQTYYGWLKTQPSDVQDSIIGPTRGKLLRDGGLSSQRFAELNLGKQFEPLSIEQMRQLDPVAFSRAGL